MGGAFSSQKFKINPTGMEGVKNLENFASTPGVAGSTAEDILGQMSSGDYSKLAGTLLSPISDSFATAGRERERHALMGGNAFYQGTQPAMMSRLGDVANLENAQNKGLAIGAAIPGVFNAAGNMAQAAHNTQLGGLQAAMSGRVASSPLVQQPGWLGQVAGALGGIAGPAMGLMGLGGLGGGGGSVLPAAQGPIASNPSSYLPYAPSYGY